MRSQLGGKPPDYRRAVLDPAVTSKMLHLPDAEQEYKDSAMILMTIKTGNGLWTVDTSGGITLHPGGSCTLPIAEKTCRFTF